MGGAPSAAEGAGLLTGGPAGLLNPACGGAVLVAGTFLKDLNL